MDAVLKPFLDARDDDARERELGRLVEHVALPLARAIVGRKLRPYAGRSDVADREDVVAEAMVALVERLRAGDRDIESFENYTAAVVHSACAHYVRRRYPARARLKNRLRYTFASIHELALWRGADGELVCGLAGWRNRVPAGPGAEALRRSLEQRRHRWTDLRPQEMSRALAATLADVGGPVDFETVVAAVADASGMAEPGTVDAAGVQGRDVPQDVALDRRRTLARVWDEVRQLPVAQRAALLLNLRGGGAGLLWLLPVAGVASIRQIADVLEIPAMEFARLWRDIPLDDAAIAGRLGCTRQQVINLRMAGRKRLANRVRGALGGPGRHSRGHANIGNVSPSLEDSV